MVPMSLLQANSTVPNNKHMKITDNSSQYKATKRTINKRLKLEIISSKH